MEKPGKVGLIAVHREMLPLLDAFQAVRSGQLGDTILYAGQGAGGPVVLAQVLPGPVNAALGAQALVVRHGAETLVSVGSAGALDPRLSPSDLVIANRAVAHDAGVFTRSRFEPNGVMGRDGQGRVGHHRAFLADGALLDRAQEAARRLGEAVHVGPVVTGNQVIFSTARKRWLHQTFEALAVEMETAAVAQVATAHRLPWLAVRAISDLADDEMFLDFDRLRFYLDDPRPAWQRAARRRFYLLTHRSVRRQLRRLHQGLTMASGRAAQVVAATFGSVRSD